MGLPRVARHSPYTNTMQMYAPQAATLAVSSSPSSGHETYDFALEQYHLLTRQHEELTQSINLVRPSSRSVSVESSFSSTTTPATSPTRTTYTSLSASRRHRGSSPLDTVWDEETSAEVEAEQQRLFDVTEGIKRALTELLNCDSVRSNGEFRMWVQRRLMETERELRSGRRRRSTPSGE